MLWMGHSRKSIHQHPVIPVFLQGDHSKEQRYAALR